MMTLDEVLEALLFRRSFRRRFTSGERTSLGIAPEDVADLASLDLAELERAARLACRGVLDRSHRGVGSLLDSFPRTFEAWRAARAGACLDDLAAELAESDAFRAFRAASPGPIPGPAIEDVFRTFCEQTLGPATGSIARSECAAAMVRAIVVNPRPSFAVPPFLRVAPRGLYSVVERDGTDVLVAALDGRFVTGKLTPLLGAILRAEDPEATAAALEGAAPHAGTTRALRELGLIE
ncbi:hypothetical protein BH11MYX4_BH11MYX4_04510 [soil metagenome]